MSGTTNTTSKTNFNLTSRFATIGVLTLALLGGTFGLATSAGAAQPTTTTTSVNEEAELGTSMTASMSVDADGNTVMVITEIATDGTVTTVIVPGTPHTLGNISGIEEARSVINLAAM